MEAADRPVDGSFRIVFSQRLAEAAAAGDVQDAYELAVGGEGDIDVRVPADDGTWQDVRGSLREWRRLLTAPANGRVLWKRLRRRGEASVTDVISTWAQDLRLEVRT